MRICLSVVILCVTICACTCKQVGYEIRGTLSGVKDGTFVFLEDVFAGKRADSAEVRDGKFVFKENEELKEPKYCRLIVKGEKLNPFGAKIASFFVDNSVMEFKGVLDSMPAILEFTGEETGVKVSGGATQELYNEYLSQIRESRLRYDVLRHRTGKIFTTKDKQPEWSFEEKLQMEGEMRELEEKMYRVGEEFVKAHRESVVIGQVIILMVERWRYRITPEELNNLFGYVAPELSESELMRNFKERAKKRVHQVMRGMKYYDVELVDTGGNKVMLSEHVQPGKYNLLDFWSSGCVPCRKEIPHLLEIHEICGDALNFISISLDKRDDRWKKAMEEEKMPWTQLCNPDGFYGVLKSTYSIPAIPFSVLVNPEGRIEYVNLHGTELDKALVDLGIWKH